MNNEKKTPEWVQIVKRYQKPDVKKAAWQIINSSIPFILLYAVAFWLVQYSYWLMLPAAILAAGFQIRLFIIQHDCGHSSFMPTRKANDTIGSIIGVFTLTPYYHWRRSHSIHHATSGDLDFRGIGDVETMTLDEYYAQPWYGKLRYRIFRHPLFIFGIAPSFLFFIGHRFWYKTDKNSKKEKLSVVFTNLALAGLITGLGFLMSWSQFLMIYLTTNFVASTVGVWLFWVQHQFEDTYWRRHMEWDFERAALQGASYLYLPKVLQWFSGNIGFHHIHHLAPKIPNYLLEKAYRETPMFQSVTTLNVWTGLHTSLHHLWDERSKRLVSFWEGAKLWQQYQMDGNG